MTCEKILQSNAIHMIWAYAANLRLICWFNQMKGIVRVSYRCSVDLIPFVCRSKPKEKRMVPKATISYSWRAAKRSGGWWSNEVANYLRGFAKEGRYPGFRRKLQFFFAFCEPFCDLRTIFSSQKKTLIVVAWKCLFVVTLPQRDRMLRTVIEIVICNYQNK